MIITSQVAYFSLYFIKIIKQELRIYSHESPSGISISQMYIASYTNIKLQMNAG